MNRLEKSFFKFFNCVLFCKDIRENFLFSWKRIKIVRYESFNFLIFEKWNGNFRFFVTKLGGGGITGGYFQFFVSFRKFQERLENALFFSSSRARIFTDALIKRMDETAGLSFIVSSAIYFFATLVYTVGNFYLERCLNNENCFIHTPRCR